MQRATFLAVSSLFMAVPLAAQSASELSDDVMQYVSVSEPVIALTNARVIDGTGGPVREGQTVVIDHGRIAAVGSDVDVPDGARVIDLTGKTVIPGLVGMHNHTFYTTSSRRVQLTFSAPKLYLASGVTTIRTTGSYAPYSEINLRHRIRSGNDVGPRMFLTGPYITGGNPNTYMTVVSGPEDARRVVAYWAEEGVDWMKAYTRLTREELGAAIDEAHQHGLRFTAHLCSVTFREAVELGIDHLEHGFFASTDFDPEKQPDECPANFRSRTVGVDMDDPEVNDLIRTIVDAGVSMTSTLAIYELVVPNRPAEIDERIAEVLVPEAMEDYLRSREARAAQAETSLWPELFQKAMAFAHAFSEAGGNLTAGVDPTGIGGALPGFGDQRNYELLLEAGFSPEMVIRIMSANGARALGVIDELGTIEPGKLADLVVINGDPTSGQRQIRDVEIVFKDGVGYDSAALIEAVAGVVGRS
ncbi:MAG: amidohydrolase family protein [Gemmatimonadetes bacterium]|nr:amidohydrolase family protein [Gemmatimonadota bacterium]